MGMQQEMFPISISRALGLTNFKNNNKERPEQAFQHEELRQARHRQTWWHSSPPWILESETSSSSKLAMMTIMMIRMMNDDVQNDHDQNDHDNRVAHQLIGASLPGKTVDGNYVPHLLIQHVGKECLEVFGEHTAFAINYFSLCATTIVIFPGATTNIIFPGATINAEHLDCPEVREHVHLKAAHNPEGQTYFLLNIF